MTHSKSPKFYRSLFFDCLEQAAANPDPAHLKANAFTRNRKIGLLNTLHFIVSLHSESVRKSVTAFNKAHHIDATQSAWCQSRDKFDSKLIKVACNTFTDDITAQTPLYNGKYRLIGVDGSNFSILPNPDEPQNLVKGHGQPHWALHLNAAYDLENQIYLDCMIQSACDKNENGAALEFVQNYSCPGIPVWIYDRLYFSYELATQIQEKGHKFLFRMKDRDFRGLLESDQSLFEQMDVETSRMLVNTQKADTRSFPELYKYVPKGKVSLITEEEPFLYFPFRLVSVEIETIDEKTGNRTSVMEYLITNLDQNEFSTQEIKELYHLRWNIENSFRDLKHVLHANQVHSRKQNQIEQEIYAAVMVYNLISVISTCAKPKQKGKKHVYKTNRKALTEMVIAFLEYRVTQKEVIQTIRLEVVPIRKDRHYNRSKCSPASTSCWK